VTPKKPPNWDVRLNVADDEEAVYVTEKVLEAPDDGTMLLNTPPLFESENETADARTKMVELCRKGVRVHCVFPVALTNDAVQVSEALVAVSNTVTLTAAVRPLEIETSPVGWPESAETEKVNEDPDVGDNDEIDMDVEGVTPTTNIEDWTTTLTPCWRALIVHWMEEPTARSVAHVIELVESAAPVNKTPALAAEIALWAIVDPEYAADTTK
jgi:hypothetical protein